MSLLFAGVSFRSGENWMRRLPAGMEVVGQDRDVYTFAVELEHDEQGFIGRECLSCQNPFKLLAEDVGEMSEASPMWCPYCGDADEGKTAFMTQDQLTRLRESQDAFVEQYVDHMIAGFGRNLMRLNRPGSAVRVSVPHRSPPLQRTLSTYSEEGVRRVVECPTCGKTQAVYGASAYCAHCGPLPPLAVALDSIERERLRLRLEDTMEEEARNEADAQGIFDSLANDAVKTCVGAFEAFARDEFYARVKKAEEAVGRDRNIFQRLDDLDTLFIRRARFKLSSLLAPDEWEALKVNFAQRHVLTHRAGKVDQRFLDAVPSSRLRVGQRLIVSRTDAEAALARIEALVRAVAAKPTRRRG